MINKFVKNILWGNSVALAWTWGIGLFFSVQMTVQFGFKALLAYVTVNALGLALFGVFNEYIAKKYETAENYEAKFLAKASNFKVPFFIYQLVAITLTLFACLKYVTLPLGILSFLVAVMFIGATIFLGEEFKIERIKYSHAVLGTVLLAVVVYCFSNDFLIKDLSILSSLPAATKFSNISDYVSLSIPIILGFMFGPWLDLQHWQRAIQIKKEGGSIANSYIVGGLIFWCILVFDGILALSAYSQSDFLGQNFSFLMSFKSIITDISFASPELHNILNAYVLFVCIASLATFDSGYIAFKWYTEPLVKESNSIIFSFFPPKLVSSPIPWFFLCILTATITMHFAEFGKFVGMFDSSLVRFFRFELEYYLAFYASFFIMYAVVFIRVIVNSKSTMNFSALKLFSTSLCSISIFGIGYFSQNMNIMGFASIVPLVYGLLTSGINKPDSTGSEEQLPKQSISSSTSTNDKLASEANKYIAANLQGSAIAYDLPPGSELISSSKCYTLNGEFIHELTPTYQDTNSVGNVYFAMYGLWVGKTREMFFAHTMPEFDVNTSEFLILTKSYSHKFLREIREFEKVTIHLTIKDYNRKFVTIAHKILNEDKQFVGKGEQSLMFVDSKNYSLIDIPKSVMDSHLPYYEEAKKNSKTKTLV